MLACQSGCQRLVLNESPKGIGTHCMTNQLLAMKTLPQEVIKSISSFNFVEANTLNCTKLDAPNKALLFHTEEGGWFFQDRLSLHTPGCPRIHSVDQASP